MQEFIGHLHPALVHLPIGILIIGVILQLLSLKEKYASLAKALPVVWFVAMICAVLSCITGFLLSGTGDYDAVLVGWHQWLAILTTFISFIVWAYSRRENKKLQTTLSFVILTLIIVVGHLGGSLTHGTDYLSFSKYLNGNKVEIRPRKPIPNIQEAALYKDVVTPVLSSACYSCHGPNKQKGKLRLDQEMFILKGGKDGKVIVDGNPDESELMKRLMLPKDHKDHMPPKGKPQLLQDDIALLHWWIKEGPDFTKKVKEFDQGEKVKTMLLAMQSGTVSEENKLAAVPEEPVPVADTAAIDQLRKSGAVIMPVAQNSNYLSANFVTASLFSDQQMHLLEPLKKQLVWLKLSNTKITDSSMKELGKFTNLTRLYLDNTRVTDAGMSELKNLSKLQFVNLVGTKISAKGIMLLKNLKELQQVYVYHAGVTSADWNELKKNFPKVSIDTGGYHVATLVSDTTEVKPPAKK